MNSVLSMPGCTSFIPLVSFSCWDFFLLVSVGFCWKTIHYSVPKLSCQLQSVGHRRNFLTGTSIRIQYPCPVVAYCCSKMLSSPSSTKPILQFALLNECGLLNQGLRADSFCLLNMWCFSCLEMRSSNTVVSEFIRVIWFHCGFSIFCFNISLQHSINKSE